MNSDDELGVAVVRGNGDALGFVVSRYKDMVYGLALSFLKDFDAAHDVSQEVFLLVFLRSHQLDDPQKLPAWLRSITANVCRTRLARRRDSLSLDGLERQATVSFHLAYAEMPDERLECMEERRAVMCALGQLPSKSRQVLSLHYLGEYSSVEIAAFLGTSPEVVRQRLCRARKQLKEEVLTMLGNALRREAPGDEFAQEVEDLLDEVKGLFRCAEYGEAIPALERARKLVPDNTLVTLLLADAHTWGRSIREVEADMQPHANGLVLLEELVVREPENILARIKLADLHNATESFEQVRAEHQANLQLARDTPFEALALLRLARVYNARGRHEVAVEHYDRLVELEPRYGGEVYRDLGVSYYLRGDLSAAISHFEEGIRFLESQEDLDEVSLPDARYMEFWEGTAQRQVALCQEHFWLAGLRMKNGDAEQARQHLAIAADLLGGEELAAEHHILIGEILQLVEEQFHELAAEAVVQHLRQQMG